MHSLLTLAVAIAPMLAIGSMAYLAEVVSL
jgi:hypothetical protein